jgi:glycosyltransferase involved in cell wall biosynthesis
VRIGVEMSGNQSMSRLRGIGRYVGNLMTAMYARGAEHQFILYAQDGLPTESIPVAANVSIRLVKPEPSRGEATMLDALARIARLNPDSIDALLIPNPLEMCLSLSLPSPPAGGPALLAVVHDLIPFVFPERYLLDAAYSARFHRRLRPLRNYDAILTNSEATRQDCLSLLQMDDRRVVAIGSAGQGTFFTPDRSEPPPAPIRTLLRSLGIDRPFVLTVGVINDRKNQNILIDAYAKLPEAMRRSHQLVFVGEMSHGHGDLFRERVRSAGIDDPVVLSDHITDELLRTLYQRCRLFVFPSLYEGFGLPILEAMHCGAPVIAGRNSSLIEATGSGGVLADADDADAIAAHMRQILGDDSYRNELSNRGQKHAQGFSWETAADLALEVFERIAREREHSKSRRRPKPRIAVYWHRPTPAGEDPSRWLDAMAAHATIDLYHDTGDVPRPVLGRRDVGRHDRRIFGRLDDVANYRGVLVMSGHPLMLAEGSMPLGRNLLFAHDFGWSDFASWRQTVPGFAGEFDLSACEYFGFESSRDLPTRLRPIDAMLRWPLGPVVFEPAALLGSLLESAGLVVPSTWAAERWLALAPQLAGKVQVIPTPLIPKRVTEGRRRDAREHFGLDPSALVVGQFGLIHPDKCNIEALHAFRAILEEHPGAILVVAGTEVDDGRLRAEVARLGLVDRVRLVGLRRSAEMADLIAASDLALNLHDPDAPYRAPGALFDLLLAGIPTIINRMPHAGGIPTSAAFELDGRRPIVDGLIAAISTLAGNPALRDRLSLGAIEYVVRTHGPDVVAGQYRDAIERIHEASRAGLHAAGSSLRQLAS